MLATSVTNNKIPVRPEVVGLLGDSNAAPALSQPVPRLIDRGRRLWLICALLVLATFVTGTVVICQLRLTALANSQRDMTNLGRVLAEQTSRTIQSVDLVLGELQSHVVTLGLRSPEEFQSQLAGEITHRFLSNHLRNLPQATMIILIDAKGALLNWSDDGPVPELDLSDREYFRRLKVQDYPEALIGDPSKGRVTGKWLMFIVRRMNGPDGQLLGLVAGLIDTKYLADFYATIDMVAGESVTLLRRDGVVITGHPIIEDGRGKHMPAQSPWYDRVAEGGGFYRSPGYLSDVPQIVTVHPVRDFALVVDANVTEQAALKDWRGQTTGIIVAMIGVTVGFTILFTVITAQFRRQEDQHNRLHRGDIALRASERRLKAYAEMAADWFWEQDAELHFSINSRIPLTSQPTDVGKARWDLADPAMDQRRWIAHRADLAARRHFRDFRWERIGTDGKCRYMSTSGDPIFDETGTFLGYHGTGRDITADVEAAEELRSAKVKAEAANRAKSEFLGNMSHELRTPLHAVIGFSELICERTSGPIASNYLEWAGDILANGRHLLGVINSVLELSKIESGHYQHSDARVDLAIVARECIASVRVQAEANRVRIDCAISNATVMTDRRAIKQVLLNLVGNAVKFTPMGGVVSIYAKPAPDGGLSIMVADTGIGIDPVSLRTLCEPFTQADGSISRKYGGTGLGLAISRKLAVLLGVILTIESVQAHGTTVRVIFPTTRVIVKPKHSVATEPVLV
jgi:signal transduction histidine kinase